MVLSNKKFKQKLRAAKAESLTETVAGRADPSSNGSSTTNPELQELLEAAKQRARAKQRSRLSRREQKRKTQPLQILNSIDGEIDEKKKRIEVEKGNEEEKEGQVVGDGENGDKKKKKKKRKREEGESGKKEVEEDGVVKEAKKVKKKKTKKKQKNKKKADSKEDGQEGETTRGAAESQMNEDGTKVYVGGIPYYSTEDDIRSYFEGCGTITGVDCMTFPDSGKFRGIAVISFKTEAAAKRALALDGADMGGFYLKIQPYKTTRTNKAANNFAPQIVKGYNRIYVGNLSWDITEDDLKKFFSDCNISSIRFGMDKQTGEFRGYGHVDFSDDLSLMMALKLDQKIVCGRPIKISCAVAKKGAKSHSSTVPTRSNETNADGLSSNNVKPTNDQPTNDQPTSAQPTSGKIKRRTCYECGEKGHISTDCPKRQNTDPANNTS